MSAAWKKETSLKRHLATMGLQETLFGLGVHILGHAHLHAFLSMRYGLSQIALALLYWHSLSTAFFPSLVLNNQEAISPVSH